MIEDRYINYLHYQARTVARKIKRLRGVRKSERLSKWLRAFLTAEHHRRAVARSLWTVDASLEEIRNRIAWDEDGPYLRTNGARCTLVKT